MFCKKCGKKIDPATDRCQNCGEPVTAAEYCGGFWNITRIGRDNDLENSNNLSTEDLSRYRDSLLAARENEQQERNYQEKLGKLLDEKRQLETMLFKTIAAAAVLGIAVIILGILLIRASLKTQDLKRQNIEQFETAGQAVTEGGQSAQDPENEENEEMPDQDQGAGSRDARIKEEVREFKNGASGKTNQAEGGTSENESGGGGQPAATGSTYKENNPLETDHIRGDPGMDIREGKYEPSGSRDAEETTDPEENIYQDQEDMESGSENDMDQNNGY